MTTIFKSSAKCTAAMFPGVIFAAHRKGPPCLMWNVGKNRYHKRHFIFKPYSQNLQAQDKEMAVSMNLKMIIELFSCTNKSIQMYHVILSNYYYCGCTFVTCQSIHVTHDHLKYIEASAISVTVVAPTSLITVSTRTSKLPQ